VSEDGVAAGTVRRGGDVRPTVEPCGDKATWDGFVERNGGSPFTSWGWGAVVETLGHDRYPLVATVGGDVVGAVPLFHVRSRLFGDQLVSVPYTAYGSVVLGEGHREVARDALLDRARSLADSLDVDVLSLRNGDLGPTERFERERRHVTFEVPLGDGPEAAWERLDGGRQRHVGAAEDEGVDVRVAEDEGDLRQFYDLYLRTMRGHGSPPHSYRFFERLWDRFHDEGTMRVLIADYEGRPIEASVDFALGSRVYAWKKVGDYAYRDLDGGSLIQWERIRWAAAEGYDAYTMGRTREGSGVYAFKKSFGGEKVWFDDYHYFPAGSVELPDPDGDEYDQLKRLWRRVPLPITRVVGPPIRKSITL
jgi:FemAB-related protein (PEP-CTERM system-associated)